MELQELIQAVGRAQMLSQTLTQQKLAGLFQSAYRGTGWQLDHLRKYEAGDNVKDIDWNVTARYRDAYVKTYAQERERLIWLLVDVSGSVTHTSAGRSRYHAALVVAATLASSGLDHQDRVGVLCFSDKIERLIPPGRGSVHFWRIAQELVALRPSSRATDIVGALSFLVNSPGKSALVFLISDFLAPDYAPALRLLAQQHELVAIRLTDEREHAVPAVGWLQLQDTESGRSRWVNTSGAAFRAGCQQEHAQLEAGFQAAFAESAARHVSLNAAGDYLPDLIRFLQLRP